MTIWMLFLAMTAAAVMAVLWPLSRHRDVQGLADPNTQFYRDQMAEIDRDRDRGLLSAQEAEAAKAEAGRRLLKATATAGPGVAAVGEPALRRRRAVSALALSVVPILALALYGAQGSPHLPGRSSIARQAAPSEQTDLASAVAQIESHLAKNPQDGRGWEVIAPVYLRTGRTEDAVRAYASALRLLGPDATRLTHYGEAIVTEQQGIVSADAREAFEKALQLDPSLQKARFYLARAAEQDGNPDRARAEYDAILASSPADAPWIPAVKEQVERLASASAAAAAAQPTRDAIAGMVEGLAARLDAEGGSAEEWERLLRSYAVLGDAAKAKVAVEKARRALASDRSAVQRIEAMAHELKLDTN
jgi:cytochrome c-type biogenesis protein CcmH